MSQRKLTDYYRLAGTNNIEVTPAVQSTSPTRNRRPTAGSIQVVQDPVNLANRFAILEEPDFHNDDVTNNMVAIGVLAISTNTSQVTSHGSTMAYSNENGFIDVKSRKRYQSKSPQKNNSKDLSPLRFHSTEPAQPTTMHVHPDQYGINGPPPMQRSSNVAHREWPTTDDDVVDQQSFPSLQASSIVAQAVPLVSMQTSWKSNGSNLAIRVSPPRPTAPRHPLSIAAPVVPVRSIEQGLRPTIVIRNPYAKRQIRVSNATFPEANGRQPLTAVAVGSFASRDNTGIGGVKNVPSIRVGNCQSQILTEQTPIYDCVPVIPVSVAQEMVLVIENLELLEDDIIADFDVVLPCDCDEDDRSDDGSDYSDIVSNGKLLSIVAASILPNC
jgi:hypothetical protein